MTQELKKVKAKKPKKGFLDGYKTYNPEVEGYGSPEKWKELLEDRMNLCVVTIAQKEENKDILTPLFTAFKSKDKGSLKKAYWELMKKWHPDRAGDTQDNKIKAQMINDKYFELVAQL